MNVLNGHLTGLIARAQVLFWKMFINRIKWRENRLFRRKQRAKMKESDDVSLNRIDRPSVQCQLKRRLRLTLIRFLLLGAVLHSDAACHHFYVVSYLTVLCSLTNNEMEILLNEIVWFVLINIRSIPKNVFISWNNYMNISLTWEIHLRSVGSEMTLNCPVLGQ